MYFELPNETNFLCINLTVITATIFLWVVAKEMPKSSDLDRTQTLTSPMPVQWSTSWGHFVIWHHTIRNDLCHFEETRQILESKYLGFFYHWQTSLQLPYYPMKRWQEKYRKTLTYLTIKTCHWSTVSQRTSLSSRTLYTSRLSCYNCVVPWSTLNERWYNSNYCSLFACKRYVLRNKSSD